MTFSLWMGKEASLRNFLRMHLIAQTDVHLAWWGRGVCVMKPKKKRFLETSANGVSGRRAGGVAGSSGPALEGFRVDNYRPCRA